MIIIFISQALTNVPAFSHSTQIRMNKDNSFNSTSHVQVRIFHMGFLYMYVITFYDTGYIATGLTLQ